MTLCSRVLGLLRDVVIANYFAVGQTDVFFTALRIPNTLRRFFGEGGFANAFVPVLNDYKENQSDSELQSLINHVFGVLGMILLLLTALGMVFSAYVIAVIGFGFNQEPEKIALGATMLRITFPYIFFISLTAFFAGILNTYHKFAILKLMLPTLLGSSAGQINILLNTALASTLVSGSITWLYYADRLVELPVALIGVALGVVILPRLSALTAQADARQFQQTLTWAFRVALLVGSAAATGLAVLALPLMMTILARGEFSAHSAQMTWCWRCYCIARWGMSVWRLRQPLPPG